MLIDVPGVTTSAAVILAAYTAFSYRRFRHEQEARRRFKLTSLKPWHERRRELERLHGGRALTAIEAIGPVMKAHAEMLKLARKRSLATWLLGKPISSWDSALDQLTAALQAYDAAHTRMLSQPIWQDDDDEED